MGLSADPPPLGWRPIAALGVGQMIAWGSSYYLPAILAPAMARDLGLQTPQIYAVMSAALVLSALVGPAAGRLIDRHGGRPVLMGTNLLFAAGLGVLALASGVATMLLGWALLGVAMGSGLYEAAFATLVRLRGPAARNAITGVTLFGGFASTAGWPLTAALADAWGWRGACAGWVLMHLAIALPLHRSLPSAAARASMRPQATDDAATSDAAPRSGSATTRPSSAAVPRRTAPLLAWVFAVTLYISTAMGAHLPQLLQAAGATAATALLAGSLFGPAQVAGRLMEFGVLRRLHPLLSSRLAALAHPLGAVLLALTGAPAAIAFALLHGASNGILTISKGTLPLALFGAAGYGERQGVLLIPARIAQAAAPYSFGLALDAWGAGALWLSTALGLSSAAALLALRSPATARR